MSKNLNRGWETYSSVVSNKCFDCITEDSSVLEIGAGDGIFTDLILEKNPKKLVVIEPDPLAKPIFVEKSKNYKNLNFLDGDIFDLINSFEKKEFEVVVAFGILYHWSSPFHFLELVTNLLDPTYICIDNPAVDGVVVKDEEHVSGNYLNKIPSYKVVKLSTHLNVSIISTAMKNLGYQQLLKRDMSWHRLNESKKQTILFKFKKT